MRRLPSLWYLLLLAACWLIPACAASEETPAAVPSALPQASLPTAVPPEGPALIGDWAISFEYEFPATFWPIGDHQYGFFMDCDELGQQGGSEWSAFQVTNFTSKLDQPIYLRLAGLSTGTLAPINMDAIHPDQVTIAAITFIGVTEQQALDVAESPDCEILFGWDGLRTQILTAGEPFQP